MVNRCQLIGLGKTVLNQKSEYKFYLNNGIDNGIIGIQRP